MNVHIEWQTLGLHDERWLWNRCLYSYLHPETQQLLYIGKADGATVKARFHAPDKQSIFKYLNEWCAISSVGVIVGALYLEQQHRISRQLVADVESLLIKRVRPVGNVSSIASRITRPGMRVKCLGDWPYMRKQFFDTGH
jgi:hypothetical protein